MISLYYATFGDHEWMGRSILSQRAPNQQGREVHSYSNLDEHYRQVYSAEAEKYELVRFSSPKDHWFDVKEQAAIRVLLGLKPGQTLLDVAAGTGRIAIPLAEKGIRVTLFDISHAMLSLARENAEAKRIGALQCTEGSLRSLPFADERFDAVIANRFLHLYPVSLYRPFVLEMWRLLRPGGVLLVQVNSALAGGVVLPLSRQVWRRLARKNNLSFLTWPHQIPEIFTGMEDVSLHGFWPPGEFLLRQLKDRWATRWERFLANGRRSFLAWHVFIRAVKPVAHA